MNKFFKANVLVPVVFHCKSFRAHRAFVGKMRLIHFTTVIWTGRINCLINSESFYPTFFVHMCVYTCLYAYV